MKYKKLTEEQILISLDRLTRFKPTKEKYLRVFFDIILSSLIEPKYKRQDLEQLDYAVIRDIATEIFNNSLLKRTENSNFNINLKIKEYENSVFYNDESTQALLDNTIDYNSAISIINQSAVINLKWLKSLKHESDLINNREEHALKLPIEKVLLVEGLTEEILLPSFSRYLGYDFYKKGVQIIPAGGKNQVVKMYYKLIEETRLPIFLLLDRDAEENIKQILPRLRQIDKIHLVSCGEFEDLLPKTLIIKTVNSHFKNFLTISENDLEEDMPMAKQLELIFKTQGLHEFKKADFAKMIRENVTQNQDISEEICEIIQEIFVSNKTLDREICS